MNERTFFPTEEMYEEFLRFSKMNDEEREVFSKENICKIKAMSSAELEEYDENLIKGAKQAIEQAKIEEPELALYMKMREASRYVSLAPIATDYFGKSKQWLYQRLKNYHVNNKPATFTPAEKERFRQALLDISRKIQDAALNL